MEKSRLQYFTSPPPCFYFCFLLCSMACQCSSSTMSHACNSGSWEDKGGGLRGQSGFLMSTRAAWAVSRNKTSDSEGLQNLLLDASLRWRLTGSWNRYAFVPSAHVGCGALSDPASPLSLSPPWGGREAALGPGLPPNAGGGTAGLGTHTVLSRNPLDLEDLGGRREGGGYLDILGRSGKRILPEDRPWEAKSSVTNPRCGKYL